MDMQLSVIFLLIIGLSIAIFIIELVRRRKLNFKRKFNKQDYRERNYNQSPIIESYEDEDDIKIVTKGKHVDEVEDNGPKIVPASERNQLPDYQDIIVINIMAEPSEHFVGYDLLQALLSAGMRFGQMSIFHRHEQSNGKGKILFSLASATKPGTFDIHKMGAVSCKGLSLFMRLSEHDEPLKVYDLLVKTASLLAEDLNGTLVAADHTQLTPEMIKQIRHWISDYQYQTESEADY